MEEKQASTDKKQAVKAALLDTTAGILAGYVDRAELARQFNLKPRTISEWIARPNGLPHLKLGKKLYFRVADVHRWLEARIRVRNEIKKRRA